MRIREATLQDIPDTFRVRLAVHENAISEDGLLSLGISPESVARLLQSVGKAWVAECDGEIVGFAIANAETASVWAVFVLPEYEGRGLGRRLLDRAVSWLWSRGVDEVWLSTNPDVKTRANGFYRYLGWKPDGNMSNGEIRYVLRRQQNAR